MDKSRVRTKVPAEHDGRCTYEAWANAVTGRRPSEGN